MSYSQINDFITGFFSIIILADSLLVDDFLLELCIVTCAAVLRCTEQTSELLIFDSLVSLIMNGNLSF